MLGFGAKLFFGRLLNSAACLALGFDRLFALFLFFFGLVSGTRNREPSN
jgi:hypothetical protein